jgi:hypothetical protein
MLFDCLPDSYLNRDRAATGSFQSRSLFVAKFPPHTHTSLSHHHSTTISQSPMCPPPSSSYDAYTQTSTGEKVCEAPKERLLNLLVISSSTALSWEHSEFYQKNGKILLYRQLRLFYSLFFLLEDIL